MVFPKFSRALLLGAALALTASTASFDVEAKSNSGITQLTRKMKSNDFRVKVQAALILGKTGDGRALPALTGGLRDGSAAVRAACAAALGTLGDPAALPPLRRASGDKSASVKRRIAATIKSLESTQRNQLASRRKAKILVKIGSFDSRASGDSSEAIGAAAQASRKMLEKIPGVALLNASEDPQVAGKRHRRPVVLMRPSLRKLSTKKDGSDTVISANVEFIVEHYESSSIIGKLSGNASAKSEVDSRRARVELQAAAVGAAVDSALSSSKKALMAAANRG